MSDGRNTPSVREALVDLCRLKHMKRWIEAGTAPDHIKEQYEREKEPAWDAAWRALESPPSENPARDELLAIHYAALNPMEVKPQEGDTLTVRLVKQFIQRAVGTDPFSAHSETAPTMAEVPVDKQPRKYRPLPTYQPDSPNDKGDQPAYFMVGYEDTADFFIARSREEVRAGFLHLIWGDMGKDADEIATELDGYMEAWDDSDQFWSIDKQHFSMPFEIGGVEAWRFPAKLLLSVSSAIGAPEWHGKLLNLWAEYTGGHIGGSEFQDMVCDLIVDNLVAPDRESHHEPK